MKQSSSRRVSRPLKSVISTKINLTKLTTFPQQILKKNPKHGETLAMKGLITNSLGRTAEAFTIAKEALRQDMKSHVCWHVYGLLYRSEKNFEESIKAYKMALRFEPESQQILRDLALLQIQMRDYQGYIESRRQILQGRPQLRQNWTGLAIAHHLAGNYADAENVLTKFEETLKNLPVKTDVEHSEAGLYKNMVIADSGDIERALENLESIAKASLDKVAVLEKRAEYLLKLGRMEEAQVAYRVLIDRNAEKRVYYVGLEQALELEEVDTQKKKELYAEFAGKYPRSDAPRRVPLNFLDGTLNFSSSRIWVLYSHLVCYRRRIQSSSRRIPPETPQEGCSINIRQYQSPLR